MGSVACPYCYGRIDRFKLGYLCTGKGTPGRPGCAKAVDTEREQWAGYVGLSRQYFEYTGRRWPAPDRAPCPKDGGESGIRACPRCHSPLPSGFGSTSNPLLALVGAKGTGKTVFLSVLAHELQHNIRRRFDATVRLVGDRQGGETSPQAWLSAHVDGMYRDLRLAAQTEAAVDGHREPLVIEWRQERRSAIRTVQRTSYLSFYDTAGEDLTDQDRVHDLEYLASADALILLLDPFMMGRARDQISLPPQALLGEEPAINVISRVTEMLRGSRGINIKKKVKLPLAVAVTKIDAFFDVLGHDHPVARTPAQIGAYDETAGQDLHENMRALIYSWGADDLDTYLRSNYENFRYFGISALGAEPDYVGSKVDPGGVRPHRVEEPLLWLLSRFDVVPRQDRS